MRFGSSDQALGSMRFGSSDQALGMPGVDLERRFVLRTCRLVQGSCRRCYWQVGIADVCLQPPSLTRRLQSSPLPSGGCRIVQRRKCVLVRVWVCVAGCALFAQAHKTGLATCPCLDEIPELDDLTVNTRSNQDSRLSLTGKQREPVDDCLVATNLDRLQRPNESYCYPTDYGQGHCTPWDKGLLPHCAAYRGPGKLRSKPNELLDRGIPESCKGTLLAKETPECQALFEPMPFALPWCSESWCYVDKDNCNVPFASSYYFPGRALHYSYDTCGDGNYFEIWHLAQLDMCESFEVVEKPFLIIWLSCWACAFMQQLIDATRRFEEQEDRLSRGQRGYMAFQMFVLVTETFANVRRVPWKSKTFWSNYNLYVYVFINSSVFVRATMMSQIVWDWYEARLLKFAVLPMQLDGKGWTEEGRAALLVLIFQFMSSLGVFGVISLTHIIPALIMYYWIFLLVAAGLVKSRLWVAQLGLNPEGRFGRALVMGTNSFISCTGIQLLVISMVRAYAGEWKGGYFVPLKSDFLSRRLSVWYSCHAKKGFSVKLLRDQDFINLFVR
eukprot:TRINITY_DN11423_c0_g1_i1.p1 TRINITY_DN11423_c0_g1~~TRINITY_DN11423_c0_g1_i1.p1  ORF type:complete len:556 (+),score=69.73 TRINITY_DN11423_c0_g1_i1:151-1818(+)